MFVLTQIYINNETELDEAKALLAVYDTILAENDLQGTAAVVVHAPRTPCKARGQRQLPDDTLLHPENFKGNLANVDRQIVEDVLKGYSNGKIASRLIRTFGCAWTTAMVNNRRGNMVDVRKR